MYFILCILMITNVTYASLFIELLQKFTKRCQTQTQTSIGIGEKDLDYASVFWQGCTTINLKFRFQNKSNIQVKISREKLINMKLF